MKVHYLEIVSDDVNAVCNAYEKAHGVSFSEPDPVLGDARTGTLVDGTIVGVRGAMRDTELPVVRPYWLVGDIEQALERVEAEGATIAMRATAIPGRGQFAIYMLGACEHGLWQL